MQKIKPFLWFNNEAEEAMEFYLSVFRDGRKGQITRYNDAGAEPGGTVLTASFTIMGIEFVALNGGPQFRFNEAVSFVVDCASQEEIDYYWEKLSEGGHLQMCGWLKDRYGLSWQVVPAVLPDLLNSGNAACDKRVMEAMMKMKKFDVRELEKAAHG